MYFYLKSETVLSTSPSIVRVLPLRHLHVVLLHQTDERTVLVLGPVDEFVEQVEDVLRGDFAEFREDVDVRHTLPVHGQRFAATHKVRQLLSIYDRRWIRRYRNIATVQYDAHAAALYPFPVEREIVIKVV